MYTSHKCIPLLLSKTTLFFKWKKADLIYVCKNWSLLLEGIQPESRMAAAAIYNLHICNGKSKSYLKFYHLFYLIKFLYLQK